METENKKIKVCIYLEFYHLFGGVIFKKMGTGLLSAYRNQKQILEKLGIEYTEVWDDSCDILQMNTPWLKSLYLIKKAKSQNKKIVFWSHTTAEDIKGSFHLSNVIFPLAKKYLRYVYGFADVIFSPSEYTKGLLVAHYDIPEEKIKVMSNGVDTGKFVWSKEKREETREQYALKRLTVGTVALAMHRKGIDSFLALAKLHPELDFVWFGKVYHSFLMKSLPKDLPSNVQFTGYVPDIVGAFSAIDIFVFLSYEENQGMVILEAASIGLPIIVRDIPVFETWLLNETHCLKAKDDAGFDACLKRLLEDTELQNRLRTNAKEMAQDHSLSKMEIKTMREYEALLSPVPQKVIAGQMT